VGLKLDCGQWGEGVCTGRDAPEHGDSDKRQRQEAATKKQQGPQRFRVVDLQQASSC